MPKGRFALLLQERQWPNAYIVLTHAAAHVGGFDECVAACEAAQTSVTRSFPGPSRRPCEVAASALHHRARTRRRASPQHRRVGRHGHHGMPMPPRPQAARALNRPFSWAVPATALLASFTALSEISAIKRLSSTMDWRLSRTRLLWVAAKS